MSLASIVKKGHIPAMENERYCEQNYLPQIQLFTFRRAHPTMTNPVTPIRVLLVHDRALVREGLCAVLKNESSIEIAGATACFKEAESLIASVKPDLLLIDIDRENGDDGLALVKELRQKTEDLPILILAGLSENILAICTEAAHLGVSGVVLKQHGADVLVKAIQKVHEGEVWFDRSTIALILRERNDTPTNDPDASKVSTITPREHEIILLVARGLKNKQIAAQLFISETTVTHHLTSIFSKLGVSDRLELVLYAFNHNLAKLE